MLKEDLFWFEQHPEQSSQSKWSEIEVLPDSENKDSTDVHHVNELGLKK
jgi:hypothetical protein